MTSTVEKANFTASGTDKPPLHFSADARLGGGQEQLYPGAAGLVTDGDVLYSLAAPHMVPDGQPLTSDSEGGWYAARNRTGRVFILEGNGTQPTTYGAELEYAVLSSDGTYGSFSDKQLNKFRELYRFMGEAGTRPTDDPDTLRRRYHEMVQGIVEEAAAMGQLAVAISAVGQREPGIEDLNPNPYVHHVRDMMTKRTGFDTLHAFRTFGFQPHVGIQDTEAGIRAAEAMQYLNPILMAPTLAAPFALGGLAENLTQRDFNSTQIAHLRRMNITPDDLSGPWQSQRHLLRMLGSPSAGTWRTPAPDDMEGYLARADKQLASGEINNIDRTNGWHTDRVRVVLDGSGTSTFEGCAYDTMLGNVNTMLPLHMLHAALFTTLERMAIQGRDPRNTMAELLGTTKLCPQQRLNAAHHFSLRETSRYGNGAILYRRQTPGMLLEKLLQFVDKENGGVAKELTEEHRTSLRKMFAGEAAATLAMKSWCQDNGTDIPTSAAYFATGVGNPATYMQAHEAALRDQNRTTTLADRVRNVELAAGLALHASVNQPMKMKVDA